MRPTRDGIHGREYISTSVNIGPKPMRLSFSASGELLSQPFELLELPIPILLDFRLVHGCGGWSGAPERREEAKDTRCVG